jgi:uncharacterized protein (TIGR00369 family)
VTQQAIPKPETNAHLAYAERLMRGEAEPPPIAKFLGFSLAHVAHGECSAELDVGPQHANPLGTLHGGVLSDLADAALGIAMSTTLEDAESFTTLDLTTKFMKPLWKTRVRASARVVKRTRRLGLIECEIEDEHGSLVARSYSTCMVLRGEEAKGR